MNKKAALFDLDGVLVDTAKFHFLAWKQLADRLGIHFSEQDNEKLKGVSREESLDILLGLGERKYSEAEKLAMAEEKNKSYVKYIQKMDASEILPGVLQTLTSLKSRKIKIGLGSASKNTAIILKNTGLSQYFDVIIDGNIVCNAKPDPEVFIKGAEGLAISSQDCVVFEDSEAGCQAARSAGMYAVGVGKKENLPSANEIIANFKEFKVEALF
ncbi:MULTISPECIES: beta-phosphoglucomutase [unclassified Enterococcus]|uniref:beta-phosphoglucomutase n=1 Tax=unclassified Enterococcus TaxID=2608891 RepID=UPI0015569F9D|nr:MULTISPECIES: beta-phosphoglucomutase [unclassified Enterococcus]MBS7576454.1 beta-phosphoglucomutase [Enterococcus sp. MMGLQ5-2]MBS7583686.1 beta-phosphoglucomutase [Enterococcus sp. MMGLQ5-1]NPD11547.1 beta-phosphoglucomutase [Enterococcus sp. MMGLQ5-1]NPD36291.1 beta-phosphoglucomutase [Enterococcus sp. MMGLQ5-2]